ncbi:L-type lectin-domain containing receptor kinase I.3 [Linum perenne]
MASSSSSFNLCRVLFLFLLAWLLRFADSETPVSNFTGADLLFDSEAKILPNGLLQLTNHTQLITGHAFHYRPITFKPNSSLSFSTTFVFAMVPESTASGGGHGIAFTISPTTDFTDAVASQHLGLFNSTNMGNSSNHVVAVELDAMRSPEFQDIDDNHVGIDLNTVSDLDGVNRTLRLLSGDRIQIWIQYNDEAKQMNVTVAPFGISKPKRPLISTNLDLSSYFVDSMFVRFSPSTTTVTSEQYILGWSFTTISGEEAPSLDLKSLPVSPRPSKEKKKLGAPVTAALIILSIILAGTGIGTYILRLRRYRELKEDWEREYNPERLSYRDLYRATHGFKEKKVR